MIKTSQCPQCGAPFVWDVTQQCMKCDSCGYTQEAQMHQHDSEEAEMSMMTCTTCGAQIEAKEHTIATMCPYCSNTVLITENMQNERRPKCVVPFSLTLDQAKDLITKYLKRRYLRPTTFKLSQVKDNTRMEYIPFWLLSSQTKAHVVIHGTKSTRHEHGDTVTVTTKHYDLHRDLDVKFVRIPVDASIEMDDDIMDRLEPFDYSKLMSFTPDYLAGCIAEGYDYTAEDLSERYEKRVSEAVMDYAVSASTAGYGVEGKHFESKSINVYGKEYTLLPVYTIEYEDKENKRRKRKHKIFVNGQTGLVVADVPVSMFKTVKIGAIVAGVVSAISLIVNMVIL